MFKPGIFPINFKKNFRNFTCLLLTALLLIICLNKTAAATENSTIITSPDDLVKIVFELKNNGTPYYKVIFDGKPVILPSKLGFRLKNGRDLHKGFEITKTSKLAFDETWKPLWGEDAEIRNHYNQLTIHLQQKQNPKSKMQVIFRAYNDGIAFRYVIPQQDKLNNFIVKSEETQFSLTGDHTCWWIPGTYDTYEMLYIKSPFSLIGKKEGLEKLHPLAENKNEKLSGVNTPITMKTKEGIYLSFHEAQLVDYAGMTLVPVKGKKYTFKANLVPWPNGDKVRAKAPMKSPWRTIQITKTPGELIESHLIVNLNDPCLLKNTSYIQPMKYIGIWWSMHLGLTSWGIKGGSHGSTTKEAKRYIDFAAKNNMGGVLFEGWNTGWDNWDKEDNFDFRTQYSDFDLEEIARYAKERGIEIIGHHETGGKIKPYEKNLEKAFSLYKKLGIKAVKTGYAGKIRPRGCFHQGQYMVRHYRKVLETAAKYEIMLDVHEPVKPTGIRRTYPNMMTREGTRGLEWNAWSEGNPPAHHVILPFTRMLAGPIDYTPGIFDLKYDCLSHQYKKYNRDKKPEKKGKMSTTLTKQLALYVVLYSPLQMAADLPENYQGHPAFQFIREVPVDWKKTKVLNGEIGEYITIARQEKGTGNWFIGSITNEKPRELEIKLGFLDPQKIYTATIYKDAKDSHYRTNPLPLTVDRKTVKAGEKLTLKLAPGGGQAISIRVVGQ